MKSAGLCLLFFYLICTFESKIHFKKQIVRSNQVTFTPPSNVVITAKVKTNSYLLQRVEINSDNNKKVFTGKGERNNLIGQMEYKSVSTIIIIFEYSRDDGKTWNKANVKTAGPYSIGRTNVFLAVSESGDDSDYNDSIVQLDWKYDK